ncbi:MAG: hypothetical protein ACREU8_12950, partial [Gammaproteobacteria bacterium]
DGHQTTPSERGMLVGKRPHSGMHGAPVGSARIGQLLVIQMALMLAGNVVCQQRLHGGRSCRHVRNPFMRMAGTHPTHGGGKLKTNPAT